ncbi:MAG: hypothetical protein KatS3mg060_1169 [Dehalococcoidia bacterium]|nr:MAG: hypothetical protein KatS3mg060_1169 [Dehalococcoidia bacterium]
MPFPIGAAQYPAVRAAIDVELTAELLPDAIIALDPYAPAAEREIKRRDPAWASRTGEDADRLGRAQLYLTAALLLPALPVLLERSVEDVRLRRQEVDLAARVAALRRRAEEELAIVLGAASGPAGVVTLFGRAPGGRAR